MLEEISSSWYRNALGEHDCAAGPGGAFLLWCTEGASFLEGVVTKMRPFVSWLTWRRGMQQQQAPCNFGFARCKLDSLLATLLEVVGLVEEEVGG